MRLIEESSMTQNIKAYYYYFSFIISQLKYPWQMFHPYGSLEAESYLNRIGFPWQFPVLDSLFYRYEIIRTGKFE